MLNMGPRMAGWVVPGIALPVPHPVPHPGTPPGYTPVQHGETSRRCAVPYMWDNQAVGLISVHQLSLSDHISGSRVMTEVYNLSGIGRIINHLCIPGTK